jgi:hypothetical protein
MSNPQLIQLASGQFLIGDVQAGDDGVVKISEPFEVSIQPMQGPDDQVVPQAAMFPFAMMSKTREFEFKASSIQLGPIDPDDNCANNWRQATSGLTMASASDMPADPTKGGLLLKG